MPSELNKEKNSTPSEEDVAYLLRELKKHDVKYVLIGGWALNVHGYIRNTNDVDLLIPKNKENAKKLIEALDFLPQKAVREINVKWFEENGTTRVLDAIDIDLMTVAANGETYESLSNHILHITEENYDFYVLDIEGLIKTKKSYRPKDQQDRRVLESMLKAIKNNDKTKKIEHSDKNYFSWFKNIFKDKKEKPDKIIKKESQSLIIKRDNTEKSTKNNNTYVNEGINDTDVKYSGGLGKEFDNQDKNELQHPPENRP